VESASPPEPVRVSLPLRVSVLAASRLRRLAAVPWARWSRDHPPLRLEVRPVLPIDLVW